MNEWMAQRVWQVSYKEPSHSCWCKTSRSAQSGPQRTYLWSPVEAREESLVYWLFSCVRLGEVISKSITLYQLVPNWRKPFNIAPDSPCCTGLYQCVLCCTKLDQVVPSFTRSYSVRPVSTSLRRLLYACIRWLQILLDCTRMRQIVPNCTKCPNVFQSLPVPTCAKLYQILSNLAKLYQSNKLYHYLCHCFRNLLKSISRN